MDESRVLMEHIVHTRYPTIDEGTTNRVHQALSHMKTDEVICLLTMYANVEDLLLYCQQSHNQFDFWNVDAIRTGPVRRWVVYCTEVERRLMGGDDDTDDTQNTVFGSCRKCGSKRLEVRTKQLRRADEGATELRTCHNCGHTSRVNS
jgi:DNA-directed RNA polymerase subunit M/transcription elongation factor TFIIS